MKKLIRMTGIITFCFLLAFPCAVFADAAIGGEYNFQNADYDVIVDAWDGYVNFRYGPGMEYGIKEPIYNGTVLHVSATADNYYDGLPWGQVYFDGYNGWISLTEVSTVTAQPQTTAYTPQYEAVQPEKYPFHAPDTVTEENLVTDAFRYERKDENGNFVYAIPMINLEGTEVDMINMGLYSAYEKPVRDAVTALETYGSGYGPDSDLTSMDYEWYVNEDILSLVVYFSWIGPWHEYVVYNFSVSKGTMLDAHSVYHAAGYAESEYTSLLAAGMETVFRGMESNQRAAVQYPAEYEKALQDTLADSNLFDAKPYLNEKGQLCAVGNIYTVMTQNGNSWEKINVAEETRISREPAAENDYYVYVDAPDGYCNFRVSPGIAYTIITPVYNGAVLHITDRINNPNDNLLWGKTTYNGQEGWVSLSQTSPVVPPEQ